MNKPTGSKNHISRSAGSKIKPDNPPNGFDHPLCLNPPGAPFGATYTRDPLQGLARG